MKYQRLAVLGSNSFAGAAFVARALAGGAEVVGFNRSAEGSPIFLPYRALGKDAQARYRFHQADINHDLDAIMERMHAFRPQAVVDFSGQGMVAESWTSPEQWYMTNIVAKVRLHDRLRQCEWLQRFIRISTPEVYGSQDRLARESWQFNPSTPYAVSHAAIDMSLRAFHQQYGFPVVFTRFANFYGPGQQLYRIVPRTIIYALSGRKLQLQGGGASVRAFIHGADVADGVLAALDLGVPGQAYHFSPQRFLSIREVVETICRRMDRDFNELVEIAPDRPGKDQAYLMDSGRARAELQWQDRISFEEGIDASVAWVRASLDEILSLPLNYIHKI